MSQVRALYGLMNLESSTVPNVLGDRSPMHFALFSPVMSSAKDVNESVLNRKRGGATPEPSPISEVH